MRITALMLYSAYALISAPVIAQPIFQSADPAHSGARVPEIRYESAFRNYVPYREQPPATWREVNDEVGRVGGHLGMFGGGAHGGHAGATPAAKPQPGASAASAQEAAGQSPARTAPTAPGTPTGR